jgi:glycosyltransferase involved in cell wall biosynthesis
VLNMNYPSISIIINCHNGEAYLKETINSVLNQTYQFWELILFDNKSTDNSPTIFKSYKDKRLKYILSKHHTPLGMARNLAIQEAKYDWVAFLDADDLWDNYKLEKQMFHTKLENIGIIYCESEIIMSKEMDSFFSRNIVKQKLKVFEGNVTDKLLIKNFIPLNSAIFLKRAFIESGGVNPSFMIAEDYDFLLKISKNYKVKFTYGVKSFYRIHQNNLSNGKYKDGYKESIKILIKYLPNPYALFSILINIGKLLYTSSILGTKKSEKQ